jgi:hypothetical protein
MEGGVSSMQVEISSSELNVNRTDWSFLFLMMPSRAWLCSMN